MANINARSPYIVTINETSQIETKLEIFLWNGTGSMPASPQYTLSKLIPSSNSPATYYDVSPFIREYISHAALQTIVTTITATPSAQWCNVGLKLFKKVTTIYSGRLNTNSFWLGWLRSIFRRSESCFG
jgi:hypothetical protein